PGREFGLQPVEGLTAELRLRRVVERRLTLTLPGGGQRRGAGGVVAVLQVAVVEELRVACQRLRPQPGGEGDFHLVEGDPGKGQAVLTSCGSRGQLALDEGQGPRCR